MKIQNLMQGVITINDPKYPKLLKKINDPPKQLYYKGNWDDKIFENCLAVVGSRRMTSYGRQIASKLVLEIASRGITIVSGFMYGIDATAHKASLDAGGRTIAVMPSGIDLIHPEYQEELYKEILENNGLIISEFEGDFFPTLWAYPKRNRIVAGLSKAAMIIEAEEKSGSLITANFAKKYNKKIFAVPGPLSSVMSKGTNQLIKQGADIVTDSRDVLEYFDIKMDFKNQKTFSRNFALSKLEQRIIKELQRESMEIDILSRLLGVSAVEIGTVVSLMQLKGLLFIENGKYYVY